MSERNPTEVASCGCPYDPEYDEGHLGWHLVENHIPEELEAVRRDVERADDRLGALEHALRLRTNIYDEEAGA